MTTKSEEIIKIKDSLAIESYYGFNLGIVLSEATQEERDAIIRVLNRAKEARKGK